ncbi:uncharacterized protein LOC129295298 [Prosopis cineraria]|uniref:uncharacterized protein LOC129295298 n=1 Tax=Prosopis cineraria TaxID=364024 RepID=UPI00240EFD50|nr:uncharacterized protein LOC129295298 [Prosopis cineraria]
MEGYGYSHQNYSTYKTDEPNGPAIRKPFVPFVPNPNRDPDGHVTRKRVVPVATRPYGDHYYTHGSPTNGYSIRDDGDYLQRQKVDDSLIHVHNEGSGGRSSALGSPVQNDNYYRHGGYENYDTYNDKERRKPIAIYTPNDNYHRHQPADTYSPFEPHRNSADGWSRPVSGWTPPPRNGTQLSEPTSDVGKALGLLKEAAKVSSTAYGGADRANPSIWAERPGNGGYHNREPGKVEKATGLAREAERLKSLKNKLLGEPKKQHKHEDDYYYGEPVDATDAARRRDDQRRYGNTIDDWQAQKKYNGARF